MPNSTITNKLKKQVVNRAANLCEYCLANAEYAFHSFPIDHIFPLSLGGTNELDNLAYSCQFCNNSKYNKVKCLDPITNEMVKLYNPRVDKWAIHFMWDESKTYIIGITPKGRATAHCLKVNREKAINLRKVLAVFGISSRD